MAYSNSPSIVTDGLVLCLDAGDVKSYPGTGVTIIDRSGNSNNGTLVDGVGYSTENKGTLVFDGTDDHISFPIKAQSASAFSYEVLLKSTNISKDQMYSGYVDDAAHYFRIVSSRAYLSIRAGGSQRTLWHSEILKNNVFYHIVSIYNGVQLKIYVNNNLTQGSVINASLNPWGISRIGRWRDVDPRSFVGNIYYFRIYSKELTAGEVFQNYNALKGRFGL